MKKFLSVLLIAALAVTMFSIPALADDLTTITVMLWDRGDAPAGYDGVENTKMTDYINEQIAPLGIKVEFVSTPRSGSDDKLITWMAPALIMGLKGRLLLVSSLRIELNASPEGSIITWEKVSLNPLYFRLTARLMTLEMD